jgi:hypothetical protein
MAALEGYNIAFKIGNKTLAGRTQDDLTIAARTKESLTKDDQGATQVAVIGHDITFRATGLVELGTDTTSKSFRNTLIANALKTGSQAVLAFKYMPTGGQAYGGNCIITNYSESSNSSDEATYTVDFRVTGNMTTTS